MRRVARWALAVALVLAFADEAAPAPSGGYSVATRFVDATPSSDARFGVGIAALGMNVVIGAPRAGNIGVAHLFDANPASPTFGKTLLTYANPTAVTGDQFGSTVAAFGADVVVGDLSDNTGADNAGAAYLLDGATGQNKQTFLNPDPDRGDLFGSALAAVGSSIAVGARLDDAGAEDAGSVYLFDPSGQLLRTFSNPTPGITDFFGFAITAVGSNLLVGTPRDDTAASDAGAAYLFDADPASPTFGQLLHTFLNPDATVGAQMGIAVAAVGTNVVIGASGDSSAADQAGIAYLFDADPASPTFGNLLHTFENPTPGAGDLFGFAVATNGTKVFISTLDDESGTSPGAVHVFDGDTASPTLGALLATLNDPTPASGDLFGFAVAALGPNVVVSAPLEDVEVAPGTTLQDAGAAYFFDTCGNGVQTVGEQCDDGNVADGDCCSSTCHLEPEGNSCADDGNPCTDQRCNQTGSCVSTPNSLPCEDADPCTTLDTCQGGTCVGGPALDCDDGITCTIDHCDPARGCVNDPDDGQCGVGDQCLIGVCLPASGCTTIPRDCDDGDPCTTDTCDPQLQNCASSPKDCNDGNACTDDACDAVAGCVHPPNTEACDDGDACTTLDTCQGGSCAGGPPIECSDGNACNGLETCDPDFGCPASQAVTPFLVRRGGRVGRDVDILGDLGVSDPGEILRFGRSLFMPDDTQVMGDVLSFGNGSNIFRALVNTLFKGRDVTIRDGTGPLDPPLPDLSCPLPSFSCGSGTLRIRRGQGALAPGNYGRVFVQQGTALALEPGVFNFCSLRTGRDVQIVATGGAQTILNVTDSTRLGDDSALGPDTGTPSPLLNIRGKRVAIGSRSTIRAFIAAPAAQLRLGGAVRFAGTFCADRVFTGSASTLECTDQ